MKNYPVTNPFYLRGEMVAPGATVELTDDEAEYFRPKDVIGKPEAPAGKEFTADNVPLGELPTAEQFAGLKADEQKALLAKLAPDADASNTEKRLELYAAYLASRSEGA